MAVQKGTTVIWSVDGITASGTGIVGSGIEQSFSRSVSSAQKEIMGDDGECQTLILHNAKADLTIEVIPTARAAFPALGAMVTVGGTGKADMIGAHSGKYTLIGGSQESSVDGETRYTFELTQYIATNISS